MRTFEVTITERRLMERQITVEVQALTQEDAENDAVYSAHQTDYEDQFNRAKWYDADERILGEEDMYFAHAEELDSE